MDNNKPKVCFLIPSLKAGGIETYLLRFLKHQSHAINATVLVRNYEKGDLFDLFKDTGAEIILKPLGYFNPLAIKSYYKLFKNQKFDTVCDFNANFAGIPMLVSKVAGVKKRITFYRQGSDHFKKSFLKQSYNKAMNRLVYKYSTAIFANSAAGLEFFFPKEYQTDNRFKVIKNGVKISDFFNIEESKLELRKQLHLPENAYIIGHTGRFTAAKNHFFLLDVLKQLINQNKNIHLVLIGNDTSQLLPRIKELNILENCTILEYQNIIPKYLKTFDLYFFPSLTEGQPNALIEAMISGLPVAASDIPAIRECIPASAEDCLINPYNVETTVNKILEIKENPQAYIYQKFAIESFDAELRFDEFLKNL